MRYSASVTYEFPLAAPETVRLAIVAASHQKAASVAVRALKTAHPGKTEALEVVYRVEGHCIRCAGAVYTERTERPLLGERPDEPTFPVSDGLDDRERLAFKQGWLSFDITTKKTPPSRPTCPEHQEEALRWYRVYPVSVEGRPASDYLAVPS